MQAFKTVAHWVGFVIVRSVQYGLVVPLLGFVLAIPAGLMMGTAGQRRPGCMGAFMLFVPIIGWAMLGIFAMASLRGPGTVSDLAAGGRRSAAQVWRAGDWAWSPWWHAPGAEPHRGPDRADATTTTPTSSWRIDPPR